VQVHGVVRYLWYPEKQPQQPQEQCGQQRTSAAAGGGEGASSAMPAQLSKRKQRSAARLEVFQRQAAATAAAAAAEVAAAAVEAAARRWLARRHVARLRAAVPPPLESGAVAPSAAKGKRRVDFCAPVPASKRVWVVTGIGAGWLRELARGEREAREAGAVAAAAKAEAAAAEEAAAKEEAVAAAAAVAVAAAPKRKVSFGAEMSPAKVVVGWQGGGDECSEAEEDEIIYSEEESGSEAAEDEWRAQGGGGGRGGGCFGGDFGDDAATLARAAQWRRENPDLAVRQAEFFHSLWDDPGGAVAKEELLALGLSPDYRHECGICDRDYMLRRGCPCCRD